MSLPALPIRNPKSDAYTIQSCLLTGDILARVLGYCRLQCCQHPSWTGERLGFELVSTPNVSRQAKRGSRYLCRLRFKAVPATIVQIALVSFDSCQHAGTAEFVHVNKLNAVQRQRCSIMAQASAFALCLFGSKRRPRRCRTHQHTRKIRLTFLEYLMISGKGQSRHLIFSHQLLSCMLQQAFS